MFINLSFLDNIEMITRIPLFHNDGTILEVVNNKGRNYSVFLIFRKEFKYWHLMHKGTIFLIIKLIQAFQNILKRVSIESP